MTLTDDFFSASTTNGSLGELGWTSAGVGVTSPVQVAGVANHPGLLQISTTTTAGNVSILYLGTSPTSARPISSLSGIPWKAIFIAAQDPSSGDPNAHITIRMGFADNPGPNPPTNGFYFQNITGSSAGNWNGVTKVGSNSSNTGGTVALDTSFHTFEIRNDGSNNITFLIDGVQNGSVITSSGFIPTAAMQPFFQVVNTETGGSFMKLLDIDAFQLAMQVSR